jgi:hypothetical protein
LAGLLIAMVPPSKAAEPILILGIQPTHTASDAPKAIRIVEPRSYFLNDTVDPHPPTYTNSSGD